MTFSEDAVAGLLARWPVARLALLDLEGEPRQLPVVFAPAAGALWSPVDGKPKRSASLARLQLLERHPGVSLLLDHYAEDWTRLWWLELRGRAEVIRAEAEADPRIAAPAAALRTKYPQYATTPLFLGPPTLVRITVASTRGPTTGHGALLGLRSPAEVFNESVALTG